MHLRPGYNAIVRLLLLEDEGMDGKVCGAAAHFRDAREAAISGWPEDRARTERQIVARRFL